MFLLLVLVMLAGAEDGIMTTPAANSSRLVKRTIMPHMHERNLHILIKLLLFIFILFIFIIILLFAIFLQLYSISIKYQT